MQFDIRRFDVYRKIPKDLTQPTLTGAFISIASAGFISYLFLAEFYAFIIPNIKSELFVDDPVKNTERVPVRIDLELPKLACEFVGLDIQDDLGRHEVGFVDDVNKEPLNNNEGCRFRARFQINKVPGNFHVSTHSSSKQPDNPDMTHFIHEVVIGDDHYVPKDLPASINPLKNTNKRDTSALATHDYFMKVVPTVFKSINGRVVHPYQYTSAYRNYMQYGHGHRIVPAIWFRYEMTPITVSYTESRRPLYHFLTTVCAIVGGTFTVAGIIDSLLFTATEAFKKFQLGKLS